MALPESIAHVVFPAALLTVLIPCLMGEEDRVPERLEPFLESHCVACHDDETQKGGLNLAALPRTFPSDHAERDALLERWIVVQDRVQAGEMPPPKRKRLPASERDAFQAGLSPILSKVHAAEKGTVLRRLNRREYANTLNDLFSTNVDLESLLPPDGRSHSFDTVGSALGVSLPHLERYLEGIDRVLTHAIPNRLAPPPVQTNRYNYIEGRDADSFLGKQWFKLRDTTVVFYRTTSYPNGMLREANVREAGWYTIRVTGFAHQTDKPITMRLALDTYTRGAEKPILGYYTIRPGHAERPEDDTTIEVRAWIPERYMVQIRPAHLHDVENPYRKDWSDYKGPGLAIAHVELEGPHQPDGTEAAQAFLFDGLERSEQLPQDPRQRKKHYYKPVFDLEKATAETVSTALERIARIAFRRPVERSDIAPYVTLFQSERDGGETAEAAYRTAVSALFCSPDFLYFQESPGHLDAHALANRIAYLLTRTAPDAQLRKHAEDGSLRQSDTYLAELKRLSHRDNEPFERFITDFTDAWLDLREIDFTAPDKTLYPEYDAYLQYSMVEESRAFFRTLLHENLPIRNLVRSDFAILNERLAEHYGLPAIGGPELRKTILPPNSVRGGVLTQGAVLKVTANGTNTSPVRRGVWVLERVLGIEPRPPPPGIPGVEPDIRGASTLRELLDKHRESTSCNACHTLIDPPGFALESFNPIGGWREHFRHLGEGERVTSLVHGRKVRYKKGLPVDASGTLQGQAFSDFNEFRELLAVQEDALARSLVRKLLTFGTGREMGFSDREDIEKILRVTRKQDHRVKDLLYATMTSSIFRHK